MVRAVGIVTLRRFDLWLLLVLSAIAVCIVVPPPPGARVINFREQLSYRDGWAIAAHARGVPTQPQFVMGDDRGTAYLMAAGFLLERSRAELAAASSPYRLPVTFKAFHLLVLVAVALLLFHVASRYMSRAAAGALTVVLLFGPFRRIGFTGDVYLFPVLAALLACMAVEWLGDDGAGSRVMLALAVVVIAACDVLRSSAAYVGVVFVLAAVWPRWVGLNTRAIRRAASVALIALALLVSVPGWLGAGSGHLRWHPLFVGAMEFGGWHDSRGQIYPYFVADADLPADRARVNGWGDDLAMARVQAVAPGTVFASPEYERVLRGDVKAMVSRYPVGIVRLIGRRLWRLLLVNPWQRIDPASQVIPSRVDLFVRLAWALIVAAALVWRIRPPAPLVLTCVGIAALAIPPLLVQSGYLIYNIGAQLPAYLMATFVIDEAVHRVACGTSPGHALHRDSPVASAR